MNIKEIEERSGLPRSGIRYYEAEGLLNPARLENGYRDYTQSDLETLLKIKRLRGLGLTLAGIRAVQSGESTLENELREALERLGEQRGDITGAEAECRYLLERGARWDDLLKIPEHPALPEYTHSYTGTEPFSDRSIKYHTEKQNAPDWYCWDSKPGPWRRFFARSLDKLLINVLLAPFIILVLRVNPNVSSAFNSFLLWLFGLIIVYALEPVCLHFFGATPGKALLGIKVLAWDGGYLSFSDACWRTKRVLISGNALNIPLVDIYTLARSYYREKRSEAQPWEGYQTWVLAAKPFRGVVTGAATAVFLAVCFCALLLTARAGYMPRHGGDINTEEFARNYNDFADYVTAETVYWKMTPEGLKNETPVGTLVIDLSDGGSKPEFRFTETDGVLTRVEFSAHETKNDGLVGTYSSFMENSVQAFIWGRPGAGIFHYKDCVSMLAYIQARPCESFSAEWCGVRVSCTYEYSGYTATSVGLLPDEDEEQDFSIYFAMELI